MKALGSQHHVDGQIVFTGLTNAMLRVAIEQQHVTGAHRDLAVLDHMGDRAAGNVGHFHVIVTVGGEIRKAGMTAQGDLLSLLHQAVAIYNKLFGKCGIQVRDRQRGHI